MLAIPSCVPSHSQRPSAQATTPPADAAPRAAPSSSSTISALDDVLYQNIATSVQGRPLRLVRVGHGPRTVLWIGGIHGDESEGAAATAALPAAFEAAGMGTRVSLLILEDANPDGRAARTRANAHGVDLNRNFQAANFDSTDRRYGTRPLSQPESNAIATLVLSERPQLVISCHSWTGAAFVNFDGPAQSVAAALAARSGLALKPSSVLGESTPGSLGSWLGHDLGVAVLTIEWARGSDPAADWTATREALLSAING